MATDLHADCANCAALCCVALPFARSVDFAIDKPAGRPCPNLHADDFGCGIHDRLRESGFRGCVAYDCFGAGQRVTRVTFGGRDWRTHPQLAAPMFTAFPIVRALHELLCYLDDALSRPAAATLHPDLRAAFRAIDDLAGLPAQRVADLDVDAHRDGVAPLLRRASRLVRGDRVAEHAGADLAGATLARADLRQADLRGAVLIAADLRRADLRETDLIGTDLRDADLRGADLRGALYLTQPQLDSAQGDASTRLNDRFHRPRHWSPL